MLPLFLLPLSFSLPPSLCEPGEQIQAVRVPSAIMAAPAMLQLAARSHTHTRTCTHTSACVCVSFVHTFQIWFVSLSWRFLELNAQFGIQASVQRLFPAGTLQQKRVQVKEERTTAAARPAHLCLLWLASGLKDFGVNPLFVTPGSGGGANCWCRA